MLIIMYWGHVKNIFINKIMLFSSEPVRLKDHPNLTCGCGSADSL